MNQELGGREWTIDGSGELLIVDRPRGDALPTTVVNALYNLRDLPDNTDGGRGGPATDGKEKKHGRHDKKGGALAPRDVKESPSSSSRRLGCIARVFRGTNWADAKIGGKSAREVRDGKVLSNKLPRVLAK